MSVILTSDIGQITALVWPALIKKWVANLPDVTTSLGKYEPGHCYRLIIC